jgi:hypothetical protein
MQYNFAQPGFTPGTGKQIISFWLLLLALASFLCGLHHIKHQQVTIDFGWPAPRLATAIRDVAFTYSCVMQVTSLRLCGRAALCWAVLHMCAQDTSTTRTSSMEQ